MKKYIANMLVKALRSGKYPQTKGRLRDQSGLCCLGVLCSLHAKLHPDIAKTETDPYSYLGDTEVLPEKVKEWAGMNSYDGYFEGTSLSELNDYQGYDFKKIAKVIEKNYEIL